MAFPWAAAIGFAGSLAASNQAKKAGMAQAEAIDRQSWFLRSLAEPYQKLNDYALPELQRYTMGLKNKMGKESDILRGKHELNLANIERGERSTIAESNRMFGGSGNLGRNRGEITRAKRATIDATNMENLSYAGAQEQFKDTAAGRFAQALGGLTDLGRTGVDLASNSARYATEAAGVRSGAKQGFYEDMSTLLGTGVGMYNDNQRWKKFGATPQTPGSRGIPNEGDMNGGNVQLEWGPNGPVFKRPLPQPDRYALRLGK